MNFLRKLFGHKGIENKIQIEKQNSNQNDKESCGIEKEKSHQRAIELIPEEFFWSCLDELAPFGSDEGDTALAEFRDWRKVNPKTPTIECLKWTIEGVGEMEFEDYNSELLSRTKILSQINDEEFDDQQYIYTLDISVIATGFAQLVDEGIIESENKNLIKIAIERQIIWAELSENWEHKNEYVGNLKVLERVLKEV